MYIYTYIHKQTYTKSNFCQDSCDTYLYIYILCVYTHILAAFGDSATIFAPAIGTGSGSGAGVAGALQILGPEMAWYSGGK